ncbi:MAG TPA: hypothetical protein VGF55_15665 [Gemmataceae bacterium]|jgi:hypothetical protein
MTRRATVIGVFSDRDKAQAAVDELRQAGFRDDQIGLVSRTQTETVGHAAGHDHARERAGLPGDTTHSKWEEGAGIGAAAGAATGTGLGLAVAAGLIPGVGPFIAGGTLMAILASAGTGTAVGTILGALVGLGVPEEEATYYESEFKTGRTILTVRADDRSAAAWDILARHGAYDFERRGDATVVPGAGLEATPY